jgi:hypothetical protein
MSKEHFMTHCVLQGLGDDPRGIFVRGFAWAPEGRWLQPETLVSPILCTSHNAALSGLDSFAQEFVDAFARIHAALQSGSKLWTVVRLNGHNLERWLLKTLCGILASGNGRSAAGVPLPSALREAWLAVLYGQADFIGTAGLYVPGKLMTMMPTTRGQFAVGPLSMDDGRVAGLQAMIPLFHGILVADNFRGKPTGAIDSDSVRRPSSLVWTDGVVEHRVELVWEHGASGTEIKMMYERAAEETTAA